VSLWDYHLHAPVLLLTSDSIGFQLNSVQDIRNAALPVVALKISPCTNVTLTLGWTTLFMGDMGEGALHRGDEVTVKQRN
jgi:hypothetical protein